MQAKMLTGSSMFAYTEYMTFSIRFTTATETETIVLEDEIIQPIDWFVNHCQTSEKGETVELLKDGKVIDTFVND